jgi:hypothetical protein
MRTIKKARRRSPSALRTRPKAVITGNKAIHDLIDAGECILADIKSVLDNWESGDLAGAVNRLRKRAEFLRQSVNQLKEIKHD